MDRTETRPAPPPVRHEVEVPLPPDAAFRLFTKDLVRWWPVERHSVAANLGTKPERVEVDPRPGGRIVETLPDGQTAPWATITEWEPGRRLALAWHPRRPEERATEVEVIFAVAGNGTRVILTHRGFGAGDTGATQALASLGRWAAFLHLRFASAAASPAISPAAARASRSRGRPLVLA